MVRPIKSREALAFLPSAWGEATSPLRICIPCPSGEQVIQNLIDHPLFPLQIVGVHPAWLLEHLPILLSIGIRIRWRLVQTVVEIQPAKQHGKGQQNSGGGSRGLGLEPAHQTGIQADIHHKQKQRPQTASPYQRPIPHLPAQQRKSHGQIGREVDPQISSPPPKQASRQEK